MQQSEETPHLLADLACDSCASHVLESIFERLAVLPVDNNKNTSDNIPLDRVLDFLLASPSIFVENPYAVHVGEKLLLRLCRILSYAVGEHAVTFLVYDPESGEEKTGKQVEITYNRDDNSAFSELFNRILTPANRSIVRKVVGVFEKLVDPAEVGGLHGNVWTSVSGSVLVQVRH